MRGHNVLFDIDKGQIGIAESECDYDYLVTGKRTEFIDPYASAEEVNHWYRKAICQARPRACFILHALQFLSFITSVVLAICIVMNIRYTFVDYIERWRLNKGEKDRDLAKLLKKKSSFDYQ